MKALVLGGNGFIGSHVVDALLDAGHGVRVLDRQPERYREPLDGVDYRWSTFDDHFAVAEALDGVDIVYHFISSTVPSTSNLDPASDVETNLVATVRLLERMRETGPRRIVFMSSGGTVYRSPTTNPVAEEHPLWPSCSHGIVKAAIEEYLVMYRELHGLDPLILRASNCYGPRQGHLGVQGLIPTFLARILDRKPLVVWGDGSVVRDYLFVEDLAELCLRVGLSAAGGIFNAGTGEGWSVLAIIELLREVTGREVEVRHEPARPYDAPEVVLDVARVTEAFGWAPRTELRAGVERTWAWLRGDLTLRPLPSRALESPPPARAPGSRTHRRRLPT